MKKTVIALTVSATMAVVAVSSSWAQEILPIDPSQVKGQGLYQAFPGFPSAEEVGQFEVKVTLDPKGKAPQFTANVNGPALRAFWGGPLHIRGGIESPVWGIYFYPEDPKPGQSFVLAVTHPTLGNVKVSIFVHDNDVPGYNANDPMMSDWFGIVIDYDGFPFTGDEMFSATGIVTNGNVVDSRE